jgi:hypothetical protein
VSLSFVAKDDPFPDPMHRGEADIEAATGA